MVRRLALSLLLFPFLGGGVAHATEPPNQNDPCARNGRDTCGTTGEGSLLTPREHREVVAATVAAAAGRVPVIAGAGSNNTATAVELARSAERAGAQALLCVTPPYLKPTQAGMA